MTKYMRKLLGSFVTLLVSLTWAFSTQSLAAAAADVDPLANPPTPRFRGQTGAPQPAQSSGFQMEVIASGFNLPRSILALPDGGLLVAEGNGELTLVSPEGATLPVRGMPPVRSVAGRGFMDIALDREFAANRTLYLAYPAPPEGEEGGPVSAELRNSRQQNGEVFQVDRVARAVLSPDNTRLDGLEVIAELPARRIVSAPDDKLFISTMGYGDNRSQVQKLNTLQGKLLRINEDGSIPPDNPFVGNSFVRPEIYAWGQRDADAAAIHPQTGELWTIEHGPMGGDELNIIRPGTNYGWPLITYGKNYDGTEIGPSYQTSMEQPRYYWFPSVAPSGLVFYTGELFPQWQGNALLGTMSPTQGKYLVRLVLDGETVVAEEHLLVDHDRRVRALAQAADGTLYVLTDSEENAELDRHFPGEVLKLTPRSDN